MLEINKIYNQDCKENIGAIADKSIKLAIYDPPYFSTGIKEVGDRQWRKEEDYVEWIISLIKETERVLKNNGSFYLFHNDVNLMTDILYRIKHETGFKLKNQITWSKINNWKSANIKDGAGMYRSILQCYGNQRNYNGSATEYLYYFTFNDTTGLDKVMKDVNNFEPLRKYFEKIQKQINKTKKYILEKIGQKADHCFRWNSSQWDLPTEETYNDLIKEFNINKFSNFKEYIDLKEEYDNLKKQYEYKVKEYEKLRYPFNQPERTFKGKSIIDIREELKPYATVWEYDRDHSVYKTHLTPKPLEMIKHIIQTSSNENDLILDMFIGSGTTAIACIDTNRNYIGAEINKNYYNLANKRIQNHLENLHSSL